LGFLNHHHPVIIQSSSQAPRPSAFLGASVSLSTLDLGDRDIQMGKKKHVSNGGNEESTGRPAQSKDENVDVLISFLLKGK